MKCKMKRKYIFKPLDISDVHFLAKYAAECDNISEDSKISKIEERLKQRFKNSNYFGVIAMFGNERIGFQDGVIVNQSLELNEIYVNEKYRGQGIGEKLMEEIILVAKARALKRVVFHTEPDNIPMQKLGEKMGFELKIFTYEKRL